MKKIGNFTRFFGHDVKSAEIAHKVLRELKCSNALQEDVYVLVRNHMTRYNSSWTDGAVKRLINRVGRERLDMFFEVLWCDRIASDGKPGLEETDLIKERIDAVLDQPMTLKDLAVNGNDLYEAGIPRGPGMGNILNSLLEMVIDYPTLNSRDTLLKQAVLLNKSQRPADK